MGLPVPQPVQETAQNMNNQNVWREIQIIQGQVIDIADTGVAADTEFSVAHGLARVPSNVEILVKEGQTDAYLSIRPGATAWTNKLIYLDCSSANAALRIRIT